MPTSSWSARQVEDGAGGLGVDVLAAQEDVAQDLLVGDVGQDPQLDLVVVDAQQDVPGLGDEAGADLAAGLGADRDVLEVRVDAAQAARRGGRLLERRVQAAVVADPVRERVQVGLGELGQLAEALDLGDDRMLVADRLQHLGVGAEAGLAAALAAELELLEEDRAELLRRADHELLARELPDLALELDHLRPDPGRDRLELLRVELDAGLLGLAQDVHERQLDLVHQVGQAALLDLRALRLRERVDEHGEGRELVAGVGGDPALLRELVERVAAAGGVEQVAGDRGVEDEVRPGRRRAPWRRGRSRRGRRGRAMTVCRVLGLPRERDVPARVGRVAPHRLARDQLALGGLRAAAARSRARRPSSARCRPGRGRGRS